MTRIDVSLASRNPAFHFAPADFEPLGPEFPGLRWVHHDSPVDLERSLATLEVAVSWAFPAAWYARAPRLRAVITPAAGNDWVDLDPAGRVPTHYGTFHGRMIAESLLALMLHFTRRLPAVLANQHARRWDGTAQFPSRMLCNQRAVIVGYGHIGRACAQLLRALGMQVTGCRRRPLDGVDPETGTRCVTPEALPAELARADHVVVLLPGGDQTRNFIDRERLAACKRGALLYNFGRGTTVDEDALLEALDSGALGGAGLDVTAVEPLPETSPLWNRADVVITPHSSCVYEEYRALHVAELTDVLRGHV